MKYRYKKLTVFLGLILLTLMSTLTVHAELLDRIVAVVENDVVLDRELTEEVYSVVSNLQANNVTIPPTIILRKQVLERLILDKLQRQFAAKSGIKVSDSMLNNAITGIAKKNNLTINKFREELKNEGISFKDFEENIRNEIIINQLRTREISSRIRVTEREVGHYVETQGDIGKTNVQYHIGHILIAIPDAPSPSIIQEAKNKAKAVLADLQKGTDFEQIAASVSSAANALKGGSLGWRTIDEIPVLFVDSVFKLKEGEVAKLIRSPSGFHIIKLFGLKGVDKHMVTKTKGRHILIKTNELINDEKARKRLLNLKTRILDGDDFSTLARSNSDDKSSAINGGDLGWVGPGYLVPPFELAMNKLAINEISDPVQTQFGWHIIQVLEREEKDNSDEFKKTQAKKVIRKRKIEEETELWLRRLRDEAFVKINTDRL
ncbi:MAG: molecular chaperone SurA [Methylococcales symbiont of Iophon sp. n. MRB-2018]|nr:MAG: molecular chaperone SurA [Methylococcales symbiont of Iophon sp. n. MRB-2018]KAF3979178.1 MAG: molecular chaperone SurA [Methylococcales symbiont of Iophon sp. n. MRB-2018]